MGFAIGAGIAGILRIMGQRKEIPKTRRSPYARMTSRAHELYTLARFEEAKRLFEKVLSKDPVNFEAHLGMGRLYIKSDLMEKAIDEYSLAIEIGIREGRDDIIERYEELRSFNPGVIFEPRIQYQLAKYMAERGEHEMALRTFQDLIMTYKEDKLIWRSFFECGKIYMKLNRPEDAVDYYKKALLKNPEDEWLTIIKSHIDRAKSTS